MKLRHFLSRQRHSLLGVASSLCHTPKSCTLSPLLQTRCAHGVPSLGMRNEQYVENGVGDLFTPAAFKTAWTDYQNHVVSRLNTVLEDDPSRRNMDVRTLLLNTARDPSLAHMFNYASMAHNNFFFFRTLAPSKTEMPPELVENVISSFSSVDSLRSSILTTANAMFGPGFVWLVQTEQPSHTHPAVASSSNHVTGMNPSQIHFRILTTYLAGSPYPQAHVRQQSRDMNSQNMQSVEEYARQNIPQNTVGSFGQRLPQGGAVQGSPTAANCIPILCVNTWEHCYLQDFGVTGKRDYLSKWWDSIDWETVWSLCLKREKFKQWR